MMKTKFNKFERVAGIFVLTAILGTLLTALSVAVKQGWFDQKIHFTSTFIGADGVHSGTEVQIAGLRAGAVDEIELLNDNRIRLNFYVYGKFRERVKKDSVAQLVRPFVIGDRVLEVSVGSSDSLTLEEHVEVASKESTDLMELMSGKSLGSTLDKLGGMATNIQRLAEAFLSRDRTESMVNIFDKLEPLLINMDVMSKEVTKLSRQITKDEGIYKVVTQLNTLTRELNQILPEMNRENPQIAKQLAQLTGNLSIMAENMKSMSLMFKDLGPEIPVTARRAIEALNEATILMKAMQKSFMLKGNVREVREEEDKQRKPSSK